MEIKPEMKDTEVIAQGAEARLHKAIYLGKATLVKERFVKNYRHPDLDARLTRDRIKAEARAIIRARSAGIATPALYLVDLERRSIYMEFVDNATVLKDFIDRSISEKTDTPDLLEFIGCGLGSLVAKLHSRNIVHGDLTTSNVLIRNDWTISPCNKQCEAADRFVMIDFGLARVDSTVEDKAVDLYVLERSLLSAHSEAPRLYQRIFHHYQRHCQSKSQCERVVAKYRQVQARGRKRLMIG